MHVWRVALTIGAAIALQYVALAQAPPPSPSPFPSPIVPLTTVPVPYDPLELVANDAQFVQSAEDRAATLALLEKARRLSNVRAHAYDWKTSFTSYGSSSSDGRWILEDTSPGPAVYRWTAQGPSFSGIFLNLNKLLSSNQPGGTMPLRLAQVREAMWGAYFPPIGPHATLRVANGNLTGAELHCILVARGFYGTSQPPFSSGRSFQEAEYCVNVRSGLLELYSPYPGLYIRYDYANAVHFHEQIIPDGFTITEAGKTVIEDKTESISEPPDKNSNLFEPAGLNPLGVGQVIVLPLMVRSFQTTPLLHNGEQGQVVVLHGMISPEGRLTEAEVLATTNENLDQAALEHANRAGALKMGTTTQPGITPQAREIVFTIQFTPRPANGTSAPSQFAPNPAP